MRRKLEGFLDGWLSGSVFTWREIVGLIIPGVLDSLSIMFILTLTTALISSHGEESMAAVALVGPVTYLVTCVFNGISAGGTVVVAQSLGKGDGALLRKSIGMTMWLTVLAGSACTVPLLLFPRQILELLYPTAAPAVLTKGVAYMVGTSWSLLFFTVYTAAFAVLRGLGESNRCLVLSVIINVAFLLFSILFLNVFRMDIAGSALALILARVMGALWAVALLFWWKPRVPMKLGQVLCFDWELLRSNLQVSLPLGLEQMCASFGNIVAEMYMIPLGTGAVATHAVANSLIGLLYAPAMSIASLSVTVVGRCIGARQFDEARRYGKRCNQLALLLLILAAAVFYPALPLLLKQYNPSPESYTLARSLLLASLPAVLLFWPMSNTLPSTLRAASDSMYPSAISLGVLWVVNIGLGYTLAIPAGLGLWGVWIATWCAWAVRTVLFYTRFRKGLWLHKSRLETT